MRRQVRQLGWGQLGWRHSDGARAESTPRDRSRGRPGNGEDVRALLRSFSLAGLIGVVFSYLFIEYVAFRALFPRLANPDGYTPAKAWAELRPLTVPFGPFLLLACAVPLAGAVLLIVLAVGEMTLGFRLLVAGLIGAGVAGVGIAERVTRKLNELAAIWKRDPTDAR